MIYATKTAIIIRADLASWQKVNVTAFLAGGLAHTFPDMIGEPYADADNRAYAPLIREPIFVFGADEATMRRTYDRAISRELSFAIYTSEMFATTNDADNRAAVAARMAVEQDWVGLGLHGERKVIDKVINGLKLLA